MYLYNSATHKKEEFKTHTPGHVEMYTCGPTVYHFAHIGNLRSYIMEDVLEKYLRYAGYSVNRVMNITDVGHLTSDADQGEDKMLKGARREHKTVMEIAQYYTDAFFEDCRKLNIKRPDVVQPATGLIDDYIRIITRLLDTGYAYVAGGNVYFDTSKLERYFRQGISYAHGSYAPFFTRPISLILLIISVLCVFWPYISDHLKAKKAAKNPAPTAANVDVNDD